MSIATKPMFNSDGLPVGAPIGWQRPQGHWCHDQSPAQRSPLPATQLAARAQQKSTAVGSYRVKHGSPVGGGSARQEQECEQGGLHRGRRWCGRWLGVR